MEYPYGGIWRDTELAQEIEQKLRERGSPVAGELKRALEQESTGESFRPAPGSDEEAIVLAVGRPALLVQDGTFAVPVGDVWNRRLSSAKKAIEAVLPSVGRIGRGRGPGAEMIGTGWLITPDVLVTNRHVAEAFCRAGNDGWTFVAGSAKPVVDFKAEHERQEVDAVDLARVLHVEPDGPDVALFKLARPLDRQPVELIRRLFGPEDVAAIGYPAWDGERNPGPDMARIFGETFEVKRLAPGRLVRVEADRLMHDCSTLGGNSGSLVLGLQALRAVGLHFAGRFREANFAVPAPLIEDIANHNKIL